MLARACACAALAASLLIAACGGGGGGSAGPSIGPFDHPQAVAADDLGYVAVIDSDVPRLVTPLGKISAIPTSASYLYAYSIAIGSDAFWIADNAGVHRVAAAQDQLAPVPSGRVAADSQGNAYVVDAPNCVVWKLTASLAKSLFAGVPGNCVPRDGAAGQGQFAYVSAITTDRRGSVYVADSSLFSVRVRKISQDGTITTLLASEGPDAVLAYVNRIAVDGLGNIYMIDDIKQELFRLDASGTLTALQPAGSDWDIAADNRAGVYISNAADRFIRASHRQ